MTATDWWKKTWAERERLLDAEYGPSQSFPFPAELAKRYPEGCCRLHPPQKKLPWVLHTLGLSQPLAAEDVLPPEDGVPQASRLGYEFGLHVDSPTEWSVHALLALADYAEAGVVLKPGSRLPLTFSKLPGSGDEAIRAAVGVPARDAEPVGEMTSAILWPSLDRQEPFVTSTGRFDLLVVTGITQGEWELAKEKSSLHVLYGLVLLGNRQRTNPLRKSLPPSVWDRVKEMTGDQILDALYGPA